MIFNGRVTIRVAPIPVRVCPACGALDTEALATLFAYRCNACETTFSARQVRDRDRFGVCIHCSYRRRATDEPRPPSSFPTACDECYDGSNFAMF